MACKRSTTTRPTGEDRAGLRPEDRSDRELLCRVVCTARAAAILKQVSSVYRGNYTTSYAANNDYSKTTKEVWINAKGYSSNTNYLVWINRAYQHVNVFTGSKGNWKLTKSFIVGTGAASTPTPVGVTTVSYKLKAGWTTGTYTVRPVVGFYPGTGYAFHSRLCYPGTDTEYDFSSGYPVRTAVYA